MRITASRAREGGAAHAGAREDDPTRAAVLLLKNAADDCRRVFPAARGAGAGWPGVLCGLSTLLECSLLARTHPRAPRTGARGPTSPGQAGSPLGPVRCPPSFFLSFLPMGAGGRGAAGNTCWKGPFCACPPTKRAPHPFTPPFGSANRLFHFSETKGADLALSRPVRQPAPSRGLDSWPLASGGGSEGVVWPRILRQPRRPSCQT